MNRRFLAIGVLVAVIASPSLWATQISLKTKDLGRFLCAENGGGRELVANRTSQGPWESFDVTDLNGGALESGDWLGFQVNKGNYICAEGNGGGAAVANRWSLGGWEKFQILKKNGSGKIQSGDEVFVRHESGYYVCAENGGGGAVKVNRTAPGGWETFYITVDYKKPRWDSAFFDFNDDGILDEILRDQEYRFKPQILNWYTYCYDYYDYDVNWYWSPWDYGWGGDSIYDGYSDIWGPDLFWWYYSDYSYCETYVEPTIRFQAHEGYEYRLYYDQSGSNQYNPANWELFDTVNQWGNQLRSYSLGTYSADDIYQGQYFVVKMGKGMPISNPWGRMFDWSPSATVLNLTRAEAVQEINTLLGRPPLTPQQVLEAEEKLKQGCVGVSIYAGSKATIIAGNPPQLLVQVPDYRLPESSPYENPTYNSAVFGDVKGFRTLEAAMATPCGAGFRTLIIAKVGVWNGGRPPQDVDGEPNEIPLDSVVGERLEGAPAGHEVFNYVTLINGKWVWANHYENGKSYDPQIFDISDYPPAPPSEEGKGIIWLRRCVPVDSIFTP